MDLGTYHVTVYKVEVLQGNKSISGDNLQGLALWSGEQLTQQHSSFEDNPQEPPKKRVKLESDDVSDKSLPTQASVPPVKGIPIHRHTLYVDSVANINLKDFGIQNGEPIQVSLLSYDEADDLRPRLALASPLIAKGRKSRLILTLNEPLHEEIRSSLSSVAQMHHRSRLLLKPGIAYATVQLRWADSSESGMARCALDCTIWWPDGASWLGSPRNKESLDASIMTRIFKLPDLRISRSKHCAPQDFYDSVHVPPASMELPSDMDDSGLRTELYPFQKRAVQWLRHREEPHDGSACSADASDRHIAKMPFQATADADGHEVFVSTLEGVLATRESLSRRVNIRGGILSEEMGLGKTCEILALICMNKRQSGGQDLETARAYGWQPTNATLIVTPSTILQQWMDEIQRHAPHLICTHYKGVAGLAKEKKQEQDAIDTFTYSDIVLTTYNVLASEVHFALDPPDRSLRRKGGAPPRKKSPLVQMHWWRTVLDEAQMVESGVSKAATTATLIPRCNAWAVSGTPVKRDVQDLRGLLIFLRCEPFASSNEVWRRLVQHYETHFKDYFKTLFGEIALRHTKDKIRGELKLPPQRRVVVTMPFTAVEEQNYQTLFAEMAYECGLALDGSPLTDDWDPADSRVIESMRTWLIRLRQTCLHPQVGGRNRRALGRSAGPLRTVEEVLAVMLEQNEAALRTETRSLISALVLKGHIVAYAKDVPDRAKQALDLYQSALAKAIESVGTAREELEKAGGHGMDDISESGSDEEDESENSAHAKRGKLRNNLRNALEMQHTCEFFVGTAYFQIKTSTEGIAEGDEEWKRFEEHEVQHYDNAKLVRKEVLQETASKAEQTMRDVSANEKERIDVPLPDLGSLGLYGGIESQKVVDKAEQLLQILARQTELLASWRSKVSELLLKRLVDVDEEETTGEEYETSTKQQDEMYIYFDAYRAVVADRLTCITGQINTLVNHEMNQLIRESKLADHDDELEGREPPDTRQFLRDLLARRAAILQKDDGLISLRGLLHEARTVESSLQWQESRGSRAQAEMHLVRRLMAQLQKWTDTYSKLQQQLVKDQELFRTAMNQRLEFYRQLQQISDAVAPYKEELDETLDQGALDAVVERLESHERQLATLQSKQRFLVHLRDESNNEAERMCVICQSNFESGVLTVCGHQFCKECIGYWWREHQTCPVCKRRLRSADFHNITYKPQELSAHEESHAAETKAGDIGDEVASGTNANQDSAVKVYTSMSAADLSAIKSINLPGSRSFGTKIDTLARHLLYIRGHDPGCKTLIFSQYRDFLSVLSSALTAFGISHIPISAKDSITRFREDPSIEAFLLDAKTDSSGLNLVNATNVLLCEPLVNPALELQAIARVHRIGQTRATSVFVYLVKDTVEQGVYQVSVARRMQLLQSHRSGTSTPAPDADVDRADRLELQAGGLERLLGKGAAGGEQVRHEDLWTCLFGAGPRREQPWAHRNVAEAGQGAAGRELGRFVRAEAALTRRAEGT